MSTSVPPSPCYDSFPLRPDSVLFGNVEGSKSKRKNGTTILNVPRANKSCFKRGGTDVSVKGGLAPRSPHRHEEPRTEKGTRGERDTNADEPRNFPFWRQWPGSARAGRTGVRHKDPGGGKACVQGGIDAFASVIGRHGPDSICVAVLQQTWLPATRKQARVLVSESSPPLGTRATAGRERLSAGCRKSRLVCCTQSGGGCAQRKRTGHVVHARYKEDADRRARTCGGEQPRDRLRDDARSPGLAMSSREPCLGELVDDTSPPTPKRPSVFLTSLRDMLLLADRKAGFIDTQRGHVSVLFFAVVLLALLATVLAAPVSHRERGNNV